MCIYTWTLCLPYGNNGFCILFIFCITFLKFVFNSVSVLKFYDGFKKIIMYMCIYTSYAADFPLFIVPY